MKSLRLFILLCLLIVTSHTGSVTCQTSGFLNNCHRVAQDEHVTAYQDWPFKLNCDGLTQTDEQLPPLQCNVSRPGEATFSADDVIILSGSSPHVTSYIVSLIFNSTFCLSKSVTVELRSIPVRDCFDDVNYYVSHDINVVEKSISFSGSFQLDCMPGPNAGDDAIYPPSIPSNEYTTTWVKTNRNPDSTTLQRNDSCDNYSEKASSSYHVNIVAQGDKPPSFLKHQVNYYDPGVYACQVTYGGHSAIISLYSICVHARVTETAPILTCTKVVHFLEGEKPRISCSVHAKPGMIRPQDLEITWQKVAGQSECTYLNFTNQQSPSHSRKSCGVKNFPNHELKCFNYVAEAEEISHHPELKVFEIFFEISDARKGDGGSYNVRMRYEDKWSELINVEFKYDRSLDLKRLFFGLLGALVTILVIAVMVALVWYWRIQLLLFMRRHYGKYDEDGKVYVATLSYNYSDAMPEVTKERTRKIVRCVTEQLKTMKYKYYDSNQDYTAGSSVENLLKYLNESHRMIIILTDAYVEENWSRFEAQQGFINMMKNKTKLIIIRTPGAKKSLKKSSKNGDVFSRELQEAIKASRNIHWEDTMSDTRLKNAVEYALPNLDRSSDETASYSTTAPSYSLMNRTVSNQTECSMLPSSPDSLDRSFQFGSLNDVIV